jgi:chlorite dismutase
VNEAFIMYNHNKTREWLHQLEPEEKKKILEDSKQEGRQFRDELKKKTPGY